MEAAGEWVSLKSADGTPLDAYLAAPKLNPRTGRGILLWQEIFGVNRHIQGLCRWFAGHGYAVIAPDMFHRTAGPRFDRGYTKETVVEGRKHKDQTTVAGLLADAQACMDFLRTDAYWRAERFGCIGFCYGAHAAFLCATLPQIMATACFYGGGISTFTPGDAAAPPSLSRAREIKGRLLMLYGEKDELIPLEHVRAVRDGLASAGSRHEVIVYPGVGHGFCCEERGTFDAATREQAFGRTLKLFEEAL